MEDLNEVPVEDLEVEKKPLNPASQVGSDNFCKELHVLLSSGKEVWRSSTALAKKLGVDTRDLDKFLQSQKVVATRPAKEEGVFLYALVEKLAKDKPDQPAPATRPVVTEEERNALAMLKLCELQLGMVIERYALKVHPKNKEAFTLLVDAREKLEAGVAVYATSLKADMSKFPKI